MPYIYTIQFSTWDGDNIIPITVDLKDYYDEIELDNKPDCELAEMAEECAWDVVYDEGLDEDDICDIIAIVQE